jgi:hypothetical protein
MDEPLGGKVYNWFYCDENIVYFSKQKENSKEELDKEMEVKNKSRIKSYNSEEKNVECGTFENNLIDQHNKKIFYCRFRKIILRFKKLVNNQK